MKAIPMTFVMFLLAVSPVLAQDVAPGDVMPDETSAMEMEAAGDDTAMDDVQFSYGLVVRASGNELVLLEYDLDADAEVEITYAVDGSTMLENLGSLTELIADDEVEIEFKEADGVKKAVTVAKVTVLEEEEVPAEQ